MTKEVGNAKRIFLVYDNVSYSHGFNSHGYVGVVT